VSVYICHLLRDHGYPLPSNSVLNTTLGRSDPSKRDLLPTPLPLPEGKHFTSSSQIPPSSPAFPHNHTQLTFDLRRSTDHARKGKRAKAVGSFVFPSTCNHLDIDHNTPTSKSIPVRPSAINLHRPTLLLGSSRIGHSFQLVYPLTFNRPIYSFLAHVRISLDQTTFFRPFLSATSDYLAYPSAHNSDLISFQSPHPHHPFATSSLSRGSSKQTDRQKFNKSLVYTPTTSDIQSLVHLKWIDLDTW
jgi:hypothetical protein